MKNLETLKKYYYKLPIINRQFMGIFTMMTSATSRYIILLKLANKRPGAFLSHLKSATELAFDTPGPFPFHFQSVQTNPLFLFC